MAWRRRGKYNVAAKADRTYNDIVFDSKKEMLRYQELELLVKHAAISDLVLQPKFKLHVGETLIGSYIADFMYVDCSDGASVVEDVKSEATRKIPLYQWKKRHVEAEYGVYVHEV